MQSSPLFDDIILKLTSIGHNKQDNMNRITEKLDTKVALYFSYFFSWGQGVAGDAGANLYKGFIDMNMAYWKPSPYDQTVFKSALYLNR